MLFPEGAFEPLVVADPTERSELALGELTRRLVCFSPAERLRRPLGVGIPEPPVGEVDLEEAALALTLFLPLDDGPGKQERKSIINADRDLARCNKLHNKTFL